MQRQYGALEGERKVIERDLALAQAEMQSAVEQMNAGNVTCSKCGQIVPMNMTEQVISDLETKVQSKQNEIGSFQTRMMNIATELDQLNSGTSEDSTQAEAALVESREAISKCDDALPQFARIRANMGEAERLLEQAREDYRKKNTAINPFEKQAEDNATQIKELESRIESLSFDAGKMKDEQSSLQFWVDGFGAKGLPVLVLRTALYELEVSANRYLTRLLDGKVYCRLAMDGDDLLIQYFERDMGGEIRERTYEKLSGGQRRCVELSFVPFAMSELIFNRCGVHISLLQIDELTTHLGQEQKRRVCEIIEGLDRDTVMVVDHDVAVQGYFDKVYELTRTETEATLNETA